MDTELDTATIRAAPTMLDLAPQVVAPNHGFLWGVAVTVVGGLFLAGLLYGIPYVAKRHKWKIRDVAKSSWNWSLWRLRIIDDKTYKKRKESTPVVFIVNRRQDI